MPLTLTRAERDAHLAEIMRDVVIPDGADDPDDDRPPVVITAATIDGETITIAGKSRQRTAWRTGPVTQRAESSVTRAARHDAARARFALAKIRNDAQDLRALAESFAEDVAQDRPHTYLSPADWSPETGARQRVLTDRVERERQILETFLAIDDELDALALRESAAADLAAATQAEVRRATNAASMRRARASKTETPAEAEARREKDRERQRRRRDAARRSTEGSPR